MGRFLIRPVLSVILAFALLLGIPSVFLQDWLSYFLEIMSSSFLVYYFLALVDYILQEFSLVEKTFQPQQGR